VESPTSASGLGEDVRSAEEVVVPTSAGEGCVYWSLPRKLLSAMRTAWALEDEAIRVNFLKGVPSLGGVLTDVELQRVAAFAEEVAYAPGALVAQEGALLGDLTVRHTT
jgi:hypothetical protein